MIRNALVFLAVACSALSVATARANGPSNTEPHNFLPLVFEEDLKQFREVYGEVQKAQEYDEQIRRQLEPLRAHVAAGELDKIVPRDVENVWRTIRLYDQAGYHVRFWGEQLGVDIGYRSQAYVREISALVESMYANDKTKRKVEAGMEAAERTIERQKRELQALDRLLDRKDYRRANQLLIEIRMVAEVDSVWFFGNKSYGLKIKPFLDEYRKFYDEWVEAWTSAARGASEPAAQKLTPDLAAFGRQMSEAATGLATLNQIEFAGQRVSGPQAVGMVAAAWLKYQRQLLQLRGVAYMNALQKGSLEVDDADKLIAALQNVSLDGMAKILAADAKRATPAEAEQLYYAYLEQFAKCVPLTDETVLRERVSPGLQQLVDRSPALKSRVTAYREATDDILRWRARAAASQASSRQTDYPPLLAELTAACVGTRQEPVFVAERDKTPAAASFQSPIPAALETVSGRLLGQPVAANDIVGLGGESSLGVTAYEARTLAYVKASPREVAAEIAQLKSDLLVTEGVAPATWEAAVGLHTAESGDFESVGGVVSRLGIIGWAAYHTSLPEGQRGMIRLKPVEKEETNQANNIVIRLIIDPAWAQHRYFYHSWPVPQGL